MTTPMPVSLRRACHACAKAKRRCVPELPQCPRCVARGLQCTYDLEPVTNMGTQSLERHPSTQYARSIFPCAWMPVRTMLFDSAGAAHKAIVEFFTPLRCEGNPPVLANPSLLALVTERFLKTIPQLTFQQQSTFYVHRQILLAGASFVGLGPWDDRPQPVLSPTFLDTVQGHLLTLDIESSTFEHFLAAFHYLVAVLLARTLDAHQNRGEIPHLLRDLWTKWRERLCAKLPRTLSSDLSAWQAWYTAESARRSLLCVIFIDGMLEVADKGYCSYRPLVESLPFDARTGLWEAETEEEWLAAVAAHGNTHSSLVSWAEFIESGSMKPRSEYDGAFQRMLLVIHFGKPAADLQDTL
ncbi:hypothetical protein PV04_04768 [Phialophora macrospora]|uniref:Zn(2)-C6 fungal-type domain-containing protein n=1 Tax=Phialophora macrospora TaxID=1851006 RepID=A0A0D2FL48_9EURO|nr:hypothetical protein PV04_04768 [Phialophora macrospora]